MTLRTAAFVDSTLYPFAWLRLASELALQEGVLGALDYLVTFPAAGGLRADVYTGVALVKGDTGAPRTGVSHGLYTIVNDAIVSPAVTFSASHASLPRVDQVILTTQDTKDLGDATDTPLLVAVAGAPTAGATLDNRSGAQALPPDSIRLADVLIPAGSTAVTAGNIRDRRPWARGAFGVRHTSADFGQAGYPTTNVWGTNPALTFALETAAGNAVIAEWGFQRATIPGVPAYNMMCRVAMDGALMGVGAASSAGPAQAIYGAQATYQGPFRTNPIQQSVAAGRHVFAAQQTSDSPTVQSWTSGPQTLVVREILSTLSG